MLTKNSLETPSGSSSSYHHHCVSTFSDSISMDSRMYLHSSLTLLTLPPELIDRICVEVTDYSSLFSLGLTCKFLASVIFPNHPLYHTIQARLSNDELWRHLIQSPLLCRYVRRLEITDAKTRMPRFSNGDPAAAPFRYRRHSTMGEKFWSYELFIRALLQMTNLQSFLWEHLELPALLTKAELWKELVYKHEHRKVKNESPMGKVLDGLRNGHSYYVPLFDTPAVISFLNLIHLTVIARSDFWSSGKSLVNSIKQCRGLEYLSLFIGDHMIIEGLVTSCRFPKLRVLLINIYRDRSPTPLGTAVNEFFAYHTSLIRLKWFVSLRLGVRLDVDLPPDSLPHLEYLEADSEFTLLLLSTPCYPPRRIRKIVRFPLNTSLWVNPNSRLRGIDSSFLRTVSFKRIMNLSDISQFGAIFQNVESLDISHSEVSVGIWDTMLREYRTPQLARWMQTLSCFTKLRYLRGIQFFSDVDEPEIIEERMELINRSLPCLEFFSAPSSSLDAIEISREGGCISWKSVELKQWDLHFDSEKHAAAI